MKIVIINGSHRKNGATAIILNEMYEKLKRHSNVEVRMVHVSTYLYNTVLDVVPVIKQDSVFLGMI